MILKKKSVFNAPNIVNPALIIKNALLAILAKS